jgi:signal transduction histidine kinase
MLLQRQVSFPQITRFIVPAASLISCLVGFLVLIGWIFNITFLKSIFPDLVSMKPNAAVAFILSGLALAVLARRSRQLTVEKNNRIILFAALGVILIGALTLFEYLFRWDLGIDQLLVREGTYTVNTFMPGRMSPLAAICFLLAGSALVLAYNRHYWSSQFLSLIILLLALVALFGYGFEVNILYSPGPPYTALALNSTITFLFLGTGILFLFPGRAILKTVVQDDAGGLMARRLLPAAIFFPLFLGLFVLAGEKRGFFGSNVAVLLITVSTVVIFTFLIFGNAYLLSSTDSERRKAENALRSRVRQQAVVAEFGRRALRSTDLSALMQEAVKLTAHVLGVRYCKILELLPDGEHLLLKAGVGWQEGVVGQAVVNTNHDSQAGFALVVKHPVIVHDLLTENRFNEPRLLLDHGIVCGISVIIYGHQKTYGVLGAHSDLYIDFNQDDADFLQSMANILADTIERYRREEAEHLAREEAEQARLRLSFLARASRILTRTLDYQVTLKRVARLVVPHISDWCAIDFIDEEGILDRVVVKHTNKSKNGIIKELASRYPADPHAPGGVYTGLTSGKAVLYPEISKDLLKERAQDSEHLRLLEELGLQSVMIVPLKGREQVFGAITFATAESGRLFNQDDLELAEELGRRAAIAVENAHLYEQSKTLNEDLERRVRERTAELEIANLELGTEVVERRRVETVLRENEATLSALVRTASRLNAIPELPTVYHTICQETAFALNVPVCTLRMYDNQRKRLIYTYGYGLPPEFGQRIVPLERHIHGKRFEDMDYQILVTADVQTEPDSPNYELFKEFNLRTTVGVSMILEGKLFGRLTLASVGEVIEFKENELVLLQGLADQAALAIQNAQLLNQVRIGREQQRQLNRQLVMAQEDERRRISKELHDDAGQALTAMKISLDLLKNALAPDLIYMRGQLGDLSQLTDETMERLRLLAHDLRPPALETLGLNKTLEGLCRQFASRTGLSIDYKGQEIVKIPDTASIVFYRLAQEALTNVAKHAKATQITVAFKQVNQTMTLTVIDNGQGFVREEIKSPKTTIQGMGLPGMQERLESIGGFLETKSENGKGTTITATVHLEEK